MLKRGYRSKPWSGAQNCRVPVLVSSLSLMLMLVILFLVLHDDNDGEKEKPSLAYELPKQKWNSFDSLVQLHPTIEYRNGTDLIWQVPESPKGVLFLAHGCNGRAINFWDKSPECPNCIGLPEERLLVLHGLAQGFAVITISSAQRCWTFGKEVLVVKDILEWWIGRRNLEKLPAVALGASSGGHFVSVLANTMKFNSIVLMIAQGMFEQMDIKEDYPPTLFVHMPKDLYRQQKIDEYVEILKDKGIDVGVVECMEFPLSPNTLADRIPGVDQTLSKRLFEIFQEKGFIDQKGFMRKDGRQLKWKKVLEEKKNLLLDKVPHIQEELNLAFAYHEMTSVHSDQIFKWFKSHMS
ncbi:Alpha/Beta hydrolase fold [Sesbania bispinosa]|nr:Alpha/Beta hydrolase fold [Sesbania bispinosa]